MKKKNLFALFAVVLTMIACSITGSGTNSVPVDQTESAAIFIVNAQSTLTQAARGNEVSNPSDQSIPAMTQAPILDSGPITYQCTPGVYRSYPCDSTPVIPNSPDFIGNGTDGDAGTESYTQNSLDFNSEKGDVILVNIYWYNCNNFSPDCVAWGGSMSSRHKFSIEPGGDQMTRWSNEFGQVESVSMTMFFEDGFCGGQKTVKFIKPEPKVNYYKNQIISC